MQALQISLPDLTSFCQQWQISELAAFGSILRDDFHDASDIDLLVTFATKVQYELLAAI